MNKKNEQEVSTSFCAQSKIKECFTFSPRKLGAWYFQFGITVELGFAKEKHIKCMVKGCPTLGIYTSRTMSQGHRFLTLETRSWADLTPGVDSSKLTEEFSC